MGGAGGGRYARVNRRQACRTFRQVRRLAGASQHTADPASGSFDLVEYLRREWRVGVRAFERMRPQLSENKGTPRKPATRRANANLPAPELGFQARLPGAYATNLRVALSCGAARRTAAGPGAVAPALARSFRARCCSGLCSDALAEPGTYFRAVVLFDGMTLHSWPVGNAIGARLKPSDMCNAARTSKLRSEGGRSRSLGGGREAHAAAAP